MSVPSRRIRSYGSMNNPVRVGARDMLLNSPDGWLTERPPAVSWIGLALEDGHSAIGPNGPWSNGGGCRDGSSGYQSYGGYPAAVERATGLIVGPLTSALPMRFYRGSFRADPEADEIEPPLWYSDPMLMGGRPGPGGSLSPAWRRRPGPTMWAEILRHALWFGKGWWVYAEASDGQPLAGSLRVMNPAMIAEDTDEGWWIGDDVDGVRTDVNGRFRVGDTTWRLMQIHEPFGDGTGVLGRHAATLRLGVNVRNYASGTFRSGIPNGYLKVTGGSAFTQEDANRLKASWLEAHGGDRRSIAVLSSTVDFTPISVKPIDAQLVEVDALVLRAIAHAFNLNAAALDSGAATGNDYANITDRRQDRTDHTLKPWATVFADTLSAMLPYGTWCSSDFRGYLATDTAERIAYYKAGLDGGWLEINDIRRFERMPKLPTPNSSSADPANSAPGVESGVTE